MEGFTVSVYPELVELGSTRTLSGTLEEREYRVGSEQFTTEHGVDYELSLSNTGEGILLTGTVKCTAQGRCARCLEPASCDIDGEVEGYYLLEPAEELDEYEEDEFEVIGADGNFDIAPALQAALVYATPYVVLCRDDCAGLCPNCGANLNEGPCDCEDDGIDPDNPFAALKDFRFDE